MAKKVQLWGYRCERCQHEWLPRGEFEPKVCPKCKSPYWDRPRKLQAKSEPREDERAPLDTEGQSQAGDGSAGRDARGDGKVVRTKSKRRP